MAKILIVDDSVELLEVLSFLIDRNGDKPIVLDSVDNLLKKIAMYEPDVIIMDVMLRGIDGRELCTAIKASPVFKNIPIILMSASRSLLEAYGKCDADAVIEKPFDLQVLYDKINAVFVNKL